MNVDKKTLLQLTLNH